VQHEAYPNGLTPDELVIVYRAIRQRSRGRFDLLRPEAYYDRPIALRHPFVFYEGHFPAFAVNTLVKLTHGRAGIDERLETLFARGIDPDSVDAVKDPTEVWPSRDEVLAYGEAADALVVDALLNLPRSEATFTILEHELMHHETLDYMLHELDYSRKKLPDERRPNWDSGWRRTHAVRIPAGRATLGNDRRFFGWDNEFPLHVVDVPAFTIDAYNVTNGEYLEFMEATGAKAPHFWHRENGEWCWRGMFELLPLRLTAPVYVTHDEATAYARWKGKRLPTEAEFHRAAYGGRDGREHHFVQRGNWNNVLSEPIGVGSYDPSPFGVYDLVGNGWEWTSTVFAPFDGFVPMESYRLYSTDFFDGAHYVLKGASPATARELVRPSFRNWFRPNYPYVYATFRCCA
jgi:iron(II)-dependent oxidoreductase